MRFWMLALLVGCTPIYDAQYDDRRRELEAFRTEFQPAANRAGMVASNGSRLFWVDTEPPNDMAVLHSIIPGDAASEIDYTFTLLESELETYRFNDDVIVECDFGTSKVFDVDQSNLEIGSSGVGFQRCAVDGRTVYALVGLNTLRRWDPPADPVDDFFSFATAGIASDINSFAIEGNVMLAIDNTGDLYKVDVLGRTSKWLRNDEDAIGEVVFDDRGVLYEAPSGLRYIDFVDAEDPPDRSLIDLVADGGYHLNFKHGDIQVPSSTPAFTMHDRHIIYRGQRGIFAYGLDTGNVIDLLLDEGESIDVVVAYGDPAVTANQQLFVRSGDGFDLRDAVYQVDLTGRLR